MKLFSLQTVIGIGLIVFISGCAMSPPRPERTDSEPAPMRAEQRSSMDEMLNPDPNNH